MECNIVCPAQPPRKCTWDHHETLTSNMSDTLAYANIEGVYTKSKKNAKAILTPMNLTFPDNSITAILGPSGCGKSTLLSLLTNSVESNIKAVADVHLPGETAFVPQDDRLHGFYTCRKYLEHYARLSGISKLPETKDKIENLLKSLGLSDQANTIVGDVFLKGLSGGQKRRLSVALEALVEPVNFFLDEPTSGLDAESAYQTVDFLKKYVNALPGRKVILTIHQPSTLIWEMLDNIILLSKGKLMYHGARKNMEPFFASTGHPTPLKWNPSEHYVTVVNDEFRYHEMSVDEWADKFKNWAPTHLIEDHKKTSEEEAQDLAAFRKTHRLPSIFTLKELTIRYFMNLWFNPGILGTRIAMYVMLALMVGALYWNLEARRSFESIQSRIAILFYCVAFFIFMSVAVVPFTVMERSIVHKEVMNKYYHPFVYQIAQSVAVIPGVALLAFFTALIIMCMTSLNRPFWYFLTMFLSLNVAEALAQLISHVVPHFIVGIALLAACFGFFMLVQGFMMVPSAFPRWLRWTYNIAFHTYSWRTFMFNEFDGQTFSNSPQFPNGETVLKLYEIDNVVPWHDALVLIGYALIVHLMSLVVLQLKYYTLKNKVLKPALGKEKSN